MAEYPDFKHGTRGEIRADGISLSRRGESKMAFVYVGTAPVHLVEGGASNVNVPILVNNMADARKYLGYSDDWASYTLCEAMHVHFDIKNVGPVVFINVLDPTVHISAASGSATLTPSNGAVKIVSAEDAVLDSLVVRSNGVALVKGTDYTVSYDFNKKVINITEKTKGSLGSTALTITWTRVDPSAVTEANVIGSTDDYGLNTGIYAIKNVYNVTGYIPAYLLAPGFASIPNIHNALFVNSQQISKHWNAYMFVDMPILTTQGADITIQTACDWKEANNYNRDNEDVFSPLVKGTDGKTYHLSVLYAANFQELLIKNDGVPYMSGSNTECSIIQDLYFTTCILCHTSIFSSCYLQILFPGMITIPFGFLSHPCKIIQIVLYDSCNVIRQTADLAPCPGLPDCPDDIIHLWGNLRSQLPPYFCADGSNLTEDGIIDSQRSCQCQGNLQCRSSSRFSTLLR
mgnify:CR=1 FL=1